MENGKIDLVIAELAESDVEWLFDLMARPEIMEFVPDRFESLDEIKEVLGWLIRNYGRDDYVRLTYKLVAGGQAVGWVSLGPLPLDETKKEIAYVVDPAYWGRGFASAAVGQLLSTVVPEKHHGDLFAEVDIRNLRSIAVLKNNGFVEVAMLAAGGGAKQLFRRRG